jgi:hypothetical protein
MINNRKAFIFGKDSLTVSYEGKVYNISKTDPAYDLVKAALVAEEWETIPELVDRGKQISNYSNNEFEIKGNAIFIDGEPISGLLSNKILEFMNEGFPYQPLIRFWKRLKLNPSFRAVNELYSFLEAANIPIMDDGRILTYKVVHRVTGTTNNKSTTVKVMGNAPKIYVDIHSGSVFQGIGDYVSMCRNLVDEDSARTCSSGLHLCAFSYTNSFGNAHGGSDVIIECALDPMDVVSIPADYNNAKLRCSRYQILGENEELTERRQTYIASNEYFDFRDSSQDSYWDDEDEEEDDEDDDFWGDSAEDDTEDDDEDDEDSTWTLSPLTPLSTFSLDQW